LAPKKWYIVHVYSGFENKVKKSLEDRIQNSPNPDKFGEVVVPTEEVVELVKGKRKTSARKFYPGYILVNMTLDDETWHIVNNTAKVTGFLGAAINRHPFRTMKPARFSIAWRLARKNRSPSISSMPAMKFALLTGRSPISTAQWMKSIRKRAK
jgi:transcription antitermination factor NusG